MSATLDVQIQFRSGADVPDGAYRFRQVFIKNNVPVLNERYTKRSVIFTIVCGDKASSYFAGILNDRIQELDMIDIEFDLIPSSES